MPKITELIERVEKAGSLKEARAAVADLTRDRRRRVTFALRGRVLALAVEGMKAPQIREKLRGKLSAPTIRKIISEEKAKC